ncbi:MAG: hypothetical protein H0W52_11765 [Rubrobacteraceae bacterium]|jgi:hypothetical protein|nr:hypothetical protein [Rubrobacteraceae bacterium]
MDTTSVPTPAPETHPHCCWRGLVFLSYLVLDEDGEEYEETEAIPCRRCAERS